MIKLSINWFYVLLGLISILLAQTFFNQNKVVISFYGFAETNEAAINYNHPVVIDRINVTPGQFVNKGDILLYISRLNSKESLTDQPYSISELLAEEEIWKSEKENQIKVLLAEKKLKIESIDLKLKEAAKDLALKKKLMNDIASLKNQNVEFQPLKDKIQALITEKDLLEKAYGLKINLLKDQKINGNNPYREKINHLNAELEFEATNRIQAIEVRAPNDGIVGNLHCKESEHVHSFNSLLSFYEPHPSLIKGYVHEDLSLKVAVGDSFNVRSIKDSKIVYKGVVEGLGSRIIEIPERLRKVPEFKTSGREVTVKITSDNVFLQKEKVALEFINKSSTIHTEAHAKK